MRILITNDDGINANGLEVLEKIANQLSDDVWVCAPETDQSGVAHSLTINDPLRLRKISEKRFALSGTPTDCAIMGAKEIMDQLPDLILSGVNSGQNISNFVTYSGTIAAAIEGVFMGVKSIALSQAYSFEDGVRSIPWETSLAHAPEILQKLIDIPTPEQTLYNVNFPACASDEVTGTQITSQGRFEHSLYMEERVDGRNFPYHWVRFNKQKHEAASGTDISALDNNEISITPIKVDMTDYGFEKKLQELF